MSILYLASEIDTALAEIRPHPGHMISLAGFRARRTLRVARFDVPVGRFAASNHRLDLFALLYHIDSLLSLPIIPEERHRYAATQLLSDVLIRHGFEGVTYRSSVGTGTNLCAFDPWAFAFDESIPMAMLDEIPYLDHATIAGRFLSCLTFYDEGDWHFWMLAGEPGDQQLLKMKGWPAEAVYFAREPVEADV